MQVVMLKVGKEEISVSGATGLFNLAAHLISTHAINSLDEHRKLMPPSWIPSQLLSANANNDERPSSTIVLKMCAIKEAAKQPGRGRSQQVVVDNSILSTPRRLGFEITLPRKDTTIRNFAQEI